MEAKYQKIIDLVVIRRNACYGPPENLLLSMLTDQDATVRELGWRRVLKARQTTPSGDCIPVREFVVPEIKLKATNYVDMIN